METYDSKTASRIVGVSLRQLQYWDEQDFIRPSVKLAEGRGTRRLYSFKCLTTFRQIRSLNEYRRKVPRPSASLTRARTKSCSPEVVKCALTPRTNATAVLSHKA